jgi:hypothetical protein
MIFLKLDSSLHSLSQDFLKTGEALHIKLGSALVPSPRGEASRLLERWTGFRPGNKLQPSTTAAPASEWLRPPSLELEPSSPILNRANEMNRSKNEMNQTDDMRPSKMT